MTPQIRSCIVSTFNFIDYFIASRSYLTYQCTRKIVGWALKIILFKNLQHSTQNGHCAIPVQWLKLITIHTWVSPQSFLLISHFIDFPKNRHENRTSESHTHTHTIHPLNCTSQAVGIIRYTVRVMSLFHVIQHFIYMKFFVISVSLLKVKTEYTWVRRMSTQHRKISTSAEALLYVTRSGRGEKLTGINDESYHNAELVLTLMRLF